MFVIGLDSIFLPSLTRLMSPSTEAENLSVQLNELRRNIEESRTAHAQDISVCGGRLSSAKSANAELMGVVEQLRHQLSVEKDSAKAKSLAAGDETSRLSGELSRKTLEASNLMEELQTERHLHASKAKEVEDALRSLSQEQSSVAVLSKEKEELRKKVANAAEDSSAQAQASRRHIEELSESNIRSCQEIDVLSREKAVVQSRLDATIREKNKRESEYEMSHNELRDLFSSKTAEMSTLTGSISSMRHTVSQLSHHKMALEADLRSATESKSQLQLQLSEITQTKDRALDDAKRNASRLSESVTEKEVQVSSLSRELSGVREEWASECRAQSLTIDELRRQLSEAARLLDARAGETKQAQAEEEKVS